MLRWLSFFNSFSSPALIMSMAAMAGAENVFRKLFSFVDAIPDRGDVLDSIVSAAIYGRLNILEIILNSQIGVETLMRTYKNTEGRFNPVRMAGKFGQTKVVELLWKAIDDSLEFKFESFQGAFFKAIKYGHLETVKCIFQLVDPAQRHALVNNRCESMCERYPERQPLAAAAMLGHADILIFLLENGADPNQQTEYGSFPLHRATFFQHPQCVRALLEYGADAHRLGTLNEFEDLILTTAREIARYQHDHEILKIYSSFYRQKNADSAVLSSESRSSIGRFYG